MKTWQIFRIASRLTAMPVVFGEARCDCQGRICIVDSNNDRLPHASSSP